MRITVVFSLIIATLAIVFAVINPLAVDINFGLFKIQGASLPLVLITTLLMGVLIGYLAWLPTRMRSSKKIRTLRRSEQQRPIVPEETADAAPFDVESKGSEDESELRK